MAHVADHLSIEDLEDRYRSCVDACSGRHYQTIWLLAQGHPPAAVRDWLAYDGRSLSATYFGIITAMEKHSDCSRWQPCHSELIRTNNNAKISIFEKLAHL
jgi:hypothetical protein